MAEGKTALACWNDPRYLKIFQHYGFRCQKNKLTEELKEAIEAGRQVVGEQGSNLSLEQLIQELADVYVVAVQLVLYFKAEGYFEAVVNEKLERQLMRIRREAERDTEAA